MEAPICIYMSLRDGSFFLSLLLLFIIIRSFDFNFLSTGDSRKQDDLADVEKIQM